MFDEKKLIFGLNPEQVRAVTHGSGPVLVIAGAGTGKTTVITRRIAWLISGKSALGKIGSQDILALTFTEKAAGEMEDRVTRLLPYGYVDLWISTFHAFCERILHTHGLDMGLNTDFRVLSQTECWMLIREKLERFDLDYYRPLGNPTKFIHALLGHFSRAKDEGVTPERYAEYSSGCLLNSDQRDQGIAGEEKTELDRLKEVARAYGVYEQILLENNALDFGDLLLYTKKLFELRPSILKKYREQFKAILVDEFQDTNSIQYEIVKMLALPNNNLTVVADDDQAIYRWRGASFNNVLQFKKDFTNCVDVVLTQNYRSQQNILDLSYKFIQLNNPNRLEWQLQSGRAELTNKLSKKLSSNVKGEAEIKYLPQETENLETRAVVEKIFSLYKQCQNWSDIAILVRSNSQAEVFARALAIAQVPFQFLAARGLFAKPVVMDAIAYLKLCDNYHESASLFRLLRSPIFLLNDLDISTLTHEAQKRNNSLYEICLKHTGLTNLSAEAHGVIEHVIALIAQGSSASRLQPASRVIYHFFEDSGYLKWLTHEDSLARLESLSWLSQFFSWVEKYEKNIIDPSVHHLINLLDHSLESGDEGELEGIEEGGSPDTVKIMTIHAAKGLEFPYVFIVGLVDRRFPTIERKDPVELPVELMKEIIPEGDWHLEEERRIMYVAITRAKVGLYFTSAQNYGGVRLKKPSRFLYELEFVKDDPSVKKKGQGVFLNQQAKETATPKKPQFNLPDKFSYTQLTAFSTCPLQYKFAHILRVPQKGKASFSFGKTMHATLENFFKRVQELNGQAQSSLFGSEAQTQEIKVPPLKELLEIYEKNWINEWYDDARHEQEYLAKGREALKDFYEVNSGKWTVPLCLEQPFNLKIGEETIKGKIDRIDKVSGGVEIIDYKTGNAPANEKQVDKTQLYLYQLAAKKVLGETPAQLTYYYLNGDKKISFLGTEDNLKKVEEEVGETINQIKHSDFTATPDQINCHNCDFYSICEFRA